MNRFNSEGINITEKNIISIREKIDPQKTLPNINLQVSPENIPNIGSLTNTKYDLLNDGQIVGNMSINIDKINHQSWIYPIEIKNEYKSKGFGLAAHISAAEKSLKEGNDFRTHDWSHTEGSKHIWDTLVEKGIAKIIEPFKSDGDGKYIGHCKITLDSIK